MPFQPVPFFHARPPVADREHDVHRLIGGTGSSRRPLTAALTAAIVLALVIAGVAVAAASSPRLSPQGWRAYKGYEAVSARIVGVDPRHPMAAHRRLRRMVARCSALPGGAAPQSAGIRATCRTEFRLIDHLLAMSRCGALNGGGAQGVCALSALEDTNRDFGANARAAATVAATLLPGRCQTAFAAQALRSEAAAQSGRNLVTALGASDTHTMKTAFDAWADAVNAATDVKLGTSDQGCRPLPTP